MKLCITTLSTPLDYGSSSAELAAIQHDVAKVCDEARVSYAFGGGVGPKVWIDVPARRCVDLTDAEETAIEDIVDRHLEGWK